MEDGRDTFVKKLIGDLWSSFKENVLKRSYSLVTKVMESSNFGFREMRFFKGGGGLGDTAWVFFYLLSLFIFFFFFFEPLITPTGRIFGTRTR